MNMEVEVHSPSAVSTHRVVGVARSVTAHRGSAAPMCTLTAERGVHVRHSEPCFPYFW